MYYQVLKAPESKVNDLLTKSVEEAAASDPLFYLTQLQAIADSTVRIKKQLSWKKFHL